MVSIRQQIVTTAGPALMRALKISIRYAVCRRQFSTIPGSKDERKVLDYQTHQYKLGTLMADCCCMSVTGNFVIKQHRIMEE